MAWALSVPLVASLAQMAALDAELGIRAEGRSTTLRATGLPELSRGSYSAVPRATLRAEGVGLLLTTAYAPRLWTSDVSERSSPFVNHAFDARLETHHDRPWRANATVTAVRATTDPLAEPWQAVVAAGQPQVATTDPLEYEELRTGAGAEVPLGPRTTVAAGAGWQVSRARASTDPALLPPQRGVSLDGSLTRLATERDTLRLLVRGMYTLTELARLDAATAPREETRSVSTTASASWRRRVALHVDAWIGGGATYATFEQEQEPRTSDLLPTAEVGIARAGEDLPLRADLTARVTTFVDRFGGRVNPIAEVLCGLGWRPVQRLSLASSASAGAQPNGDTKLARADARAAWTPRDRLAFELGVAGRLQRDRRPELPSFDEAASFAGVAWTVRERLALEAGVMGRWHRERRPSEPSFFEGAVFAGVAYATDRLFRSMAR
jgi:hypothetical protein